MTDSGNKTVDEIAELKARIKQLESEREDLLERSNRVVAESQQKIYWLERWHIDLNKLMRRRWTEDLRASMRIFRAGMRRIYDRYRKFSRQRDRQKHKKV